MADKEMSDWIKFFTGAGIPPGPASTYSLSFIDNRIKRNMLIDLTKEYLKEMGISVMGDVIAILKYARSTHLKEEREKPALSALAATPDGKIEIKRQTTAGNRMLEHYMRKEAGNRMLEHYMRKEGMISSEPEPKVKVTTEMAARLGAVPKTGSKSTLDISRVKQVEVVPIKKSRQAPPAPETDNKTPVVSDCKKSVFDRLGAGESTTTTTSKDTVLKRSKSDSQVTFSGLDSTDPGSSVFGRLGGVKRQKTISLSSDDGSECDYHGVLKPEGLTSKPSKRMKAIKDLNESEQLTLLDRLGKKFAQTKPKPIDVVEKKSLLQRLGPQKTNVIVTLGSPMTNVSGRLGPMKSEALTPTKTKVSGRLGPKKSEALSPSTAKVSGRLGPKKSEETNVTVTLGSPKVNVSGRLGPKTISNSPSSPVKITRTVSNIGKSSVQERLGIQKAEASSTSDIGVVKTTTKKVTTTSLSNIQDRLGDKKSAATKITIRKGAGIVKRLGTQTKSVPTTQAARKTGIIARLGATEKKVVKSVPKGKNTGAVLERLGLPITKTEIATVTSILATARSKTTNVKTRLGAQKTEATSTTPSITITTSKAGTKKTVFTKPASNTLAKKPTVIRKSPIGKVSSSAGVFSRLGSK